MKKYTVTHLYHDIQTDSDAVVAFLNDHEAIVRISYETTRCDAAINFASDIKPLHAIEVLRAFSKRFYELYAELPAESAPNEVPLFSFEVED